MSFEAVTSISQAEEAAAKVVAEAKQKAAQMVLDAEAAGKASIENSVKKADEELLQLKDKADKLSEKSASDFLAGVEDEKSKLRSAAQDKLEKAATLVVERIVNG